MAELIVALDHPSGREALALVSRLPSLRWVKIGPVLYVRDGPALVRELAARGVQVFLDLKWHDIPSTVAGAVTAARDLGVQLATVHCLGGTAMLEAAVRAAGDLPLVGVTVLTSHDAPGLGAVLGKSVADVGAEVERLARLASAARLRGVVASGHEIGAVRRAFGGAPWIVVPGIRLPADPAGDQARTVTPAAAVTAGASHLVVGRTITHAANPAAVYDEIRACL